MRFIFITNVPEIAAYVTARGVDRVMVDLEVLGKDARQGHLNTLISRHRLADVAAVRAAVPPGSLMVRVDPLNDASSEDLDAVLSAGADAIMLPMFRQPADVAAFSRLLNGRAKLVLLAETRGAMETLGESAAIDGVDEVHIGLNDLSLDLGLPFLFQPLARGLVDGMAAAVCDAGKPLGIGGVARADEGLLPARLLMGEHVRLGSTGAILSRTFHRSAASVAEIADGMDFAGEVAALRAAYADCARMDPAALERNRREVVERIDEIAAGMGTR